MAFNKIKRFVAVLVMLSVFATVLPVVYATDAYSKYTDFPNGWSKTAVEHAVDNSLLSGRTETTINPGDHLTRAEMATIINRAFGATVKASVSKYTDVTPDDWYYEEIAKAVNMRTFVGDSGSTMNPNQNITREAVFTVIARALVLETEDYSSLTRYPDADKVSDWAKSSAAILVSKGYVKGNDAGLLCPQCYITREEFAQLMYNIFKTYYVTSGEHTTTGNDSSLIRTSGVVLRNVTIDGDLVLGDGVGNGTVRLENVTINGRLLCRGGEKSVKLVNTKVNEGVVVYDVNGTVHFDNYRTDVVFKGIKLLTPATFLKKSGSGGSSSGGADEPDEPEEPEYYNVSFHNGSNPEAFDTVKINKAEKEEDRNLAFLEKSLDVIYEDYTSATLPAYNRDSFGYNNLDAEYEHQVNKEYIYESAPGVWSVFTDETTVSKDIDVYYAAKRTVVEATVPVVDIPYSVEIRYDSKSRFTNSFIDAMISTGSTLEKEEVKDKINSKITGIYNKINEEIGMLDSDGNIYDIKLGLKLTDVIDYHQIEDQVETDLGISLDGNADYNNFIAYFDGNKLEVNKENIYFAHAVGEAIYNFEFSEILKILKSKGFGPLLTFLDSVKEGYAQEIFETSVKDYGLTLMDLATTVENSPNDDIKLEYSTKINVPINAPEIIDNIYTRYADKFIAKIENSDIYDYDKNISLKKFLNIDWFSMVIGYDSNCVNETTGATGYYIKDYMDIYGSMLDALILFDDALCFYNVEDYDDEELILVKKGLTKEFIAFLTELESLSDKINNGQPIKGGYTLQDLIDKMDSVKNVADSLGGTASDSVASSLESVIDNVKDILEKLGEGNLPNGGTLDDLTIVSGKLKDVIEGMNEGRYEEINATFEELISSSMNRLSEIIDELDKDGTISGKPLDSIFAKISALNSIYQRYSAQIESIISALANVDLGSLDIPVTAEKFEDIIFGREEGDVFNIDSAIDAVKTKLGNSEKSGYDETDRVYVIDQYSKSLGNIEITVQRRFY